MNVEIMLEAIQKKLLENARPETAESIHKFVPGSTRVYGNKMPLLNELAKEFKSGGFDLVERLWNAGAFEEKMLAVKLLGKIAKQDPNQSLKMIEQFAPGIDNWAICDTIGMQGLKLILKSHQSQIFTLANKYNHSENFWERRLSLVLVEWYTRDKILHEQIIQLIKHLENDKEYYVKKAVEWIKRNLKKGK